MPGYLRQLSKAKHSLRNSVCCALAGGSTCPWSDQFNFWRMHMRNEMLSLRLAQAVLAVAATAASAVVLQLALVIG